MIHRTFIANPNNSCEHVTILYYYILSRFSVRSLCVTIIGIPFGYSSRKMSNRYGYCTHHEGIVIRLSRGDENPFSQTPIPLHIGFSKRGPLDAMNFHQDLKKLGYSRRYLMVGGGALWVGEIEERRENGVDKSIRTFALLILAWLRVEYDFTTKRVEVNYFRVGGQGEWGGVNKLHLKWKRGYENIRSAIEEKN